MIRINLLPVREARRQANARQQGVFIGIAATAALIVCVGAYFWMAAKISSEQHQIQLAKAELRELEAVQKKVDEFTREREEIENKLQVIAKLESVRSGPVRLMNELADRIPQRVWLTKAVAKGGALELEGYSMDAEIVATFLTGLEESPVFSKVELQETNLNDLEGLKVNKFKVSSTYPYVSPESLMPAPAANPTPGAR